MSHQSLVEIAAASANARPLEPFMPRHFSERRRRGLNRAVAHGLSLSPDQQPAILRSFGRRPSEAERRRYIELQRRRDARAAELEIDPTLIASRAVLSDLAHNWDKNSADLMNWQRKLLS